MKRLLFIPLIFLCSALWAADSCKEPVQLARMNPYIAGAGVAATCTTILAQELTVDTEYSVAVSDGSTYVGAGNFTVAGTKNICGVDVYVYAINGSMTGISYQVEVRATTGSGGDLIAADPGCVSSSIAGTSLTTSQFNKFTGLACTKSTGTYYAIVVTRTDHGNSAANYITIGTDSAGGEGMGMKSRYESTGTFGNSFGDTVAFKIYEN